MRNLHAFNLYEHSRNSAAGTLFTAIIDTTEKLFLPAWPEIGISESGGVFIPVSGGEISYAYGCVERD